jgi:hypothetical protein
MTLSTMDAEEQVGRFAASKRRGVAFEWEPFKANDS